jgi:hypothetical protein
MRAGTIMGHVGAFRAVLGAHLPEFLVPMDDQAWWQERHLLLQTCAEKETDEPRVRVLLDAHARVFQCLWGAQSHLERGEHGLWRNNITGCVERLAATMHRCAAKRMLLTVRVWHRRAASLANAHRCRHHRTHCASTQHASMHASMLFFIRRSLTPRCLHRAQHVPGDLPRQRRAERIPVRDVPRAAREARAH